LNAAAGRGPGFVTGLCTRHGEMARTAETPKIVIHTRRPLTEVSTAIRDRPRPKERHRSAYNPTTTGTWTTGTARTPTGPLAGQWPW
jgi:hypothetical protein